jgi:hypothetical protein
VLRGLGRGEAQGGVMSRLACCTVVYRTGVSPDPALRAAAERLAARGLAVDGLLQRGARGSSACCGTMAFVALASGRSVAALSDRGPLARGCRIDLDGLETAAGWLTEAIARRPDVLFVNRFGRQEAEGRGLRGEIAGALLEGVPLVVAVNADLLPDWAAFLGETVRPVAPDADEIVAWRLALAADCASPA